MAPVNIEKAFFEYLAAEFEACEGAHQPSPQADHAKRIVERGREALESVTKAEIFELEMLILALQSTERLARRAPGLRLKYGELAGSRLAAPYTPAPLPPPDRYSDPAARRPLLAELQQIMSFLHWTYFFTPIREGIRRSILLVAVWCMVACTIGGVVLSFVFHRYGWDFQALLVAVVYAGLMGGFISSQRRMQTIPTNGDPLNAIYELQNGRYFLWFAPLTGAVFAVVLMFLFIGKVLQGVAFPAFFSLAPAAGSEAAPQHWYFIAQLLPRTSVDYALLFVWSFIAGFAERLVPDALDRLASRAKESGAAPASPPPAATGKAKAAEAEDDDTPEEDA